MRKIIIVLLAFFVCSCSTFFNTPNDTPNDSEAMTELKNELVGVDFMEYFDFRKYRIELFGIEYSDPDAFDLFFRWSQPSI